MNAIEVFGADHIMAGRRVWGVYTDANVAHEHRVYLVQQGREPKLYKRQVRAENMTIVVHVLCCESDEVMAEKDGGR